MKSEYRHIRYGFLAAVLLASIGWLLWGLNLIETVKALTPGIIPMAGWAWSSNIGWVSFHCDNTGTTTTFPCSTSNYKVEVNVNTGRFQGYAWSPSIGWINFAPTGPYPEAPLVPASFNSSTGEVTGWIRAISPLNINNFGNTGGWDGWIKMYDGFDGAARFELPTGTMTGFAWGGDVVGWLNFYDVWVPPTCDFAPKPKSIVPPQPSDFAWRCIFATQCSVTGLNIVSGSTTCATGEECLADHTFRVRPTSTQSYVLSCTNKNGQATITENVTVLLHPRIRETSTVGF